MAKDYQKSSVYRLYLDTADSWGSPTWVLIKACGDIDVTSNPDDVQVPERNGPTGHMLGEDDPSVTFTLFEDAGDANVETLISALGSGDMTHIAVARGDITTSGVKYWHLEAVLMGVSLSTPARGNVAQYSVEAKRHANSDNPMERATASA